MTTHGRIEELLAVRALGGLDGSDVETLERELAAHGDCAECRRLEDEFVETAAMLADSLTPEPVGAGMVEAILSASPRGVGTVVAVPEAAEPTAETRSDDLSEPRRRRSSWRTAVAVAAAFVVVVGGGALGLRLSTSVPIRSVALSQRIVQFQGDTGSLLMAYTPGEAGAVLFGAGLPKVGAGEVYEVWTITGKEATSAGCASSSNGILHTSVSADVGNADLMAITIERATCPAAPTQTPILTAPVSA
ncbi:MAG: Anti-sigma-K factor rskA [Chloroflexota bacterium]|nr:Anti-sigma-K factor rskA [Chloroflexota bacterium]